MPSLKILLQLAGAQSQVLGTCSRVTETARSEEDTVQACQLLDLPVIPPNLCNSHLYQVVLQQYDVYTVWVCILYGVYPLGLGKQNLNQTLFVEHKKI